MFLQILAFLGLLFSFSTIASSREQYTYKCECKRLCNENEINSTVRCGEFIWCCNQTDGVVTTNWEDTENETSSMNNKTESTESPTKSWRQQDIVSERENKTYGVDQNKTHHAEFQESVAIPGRNSSTVSSMDKTAVSNKRIQNENLKLSNLKIKLSNKLHPKHVMEHVNNNFQDGTKNFPRREVENIVKVQRTPIYRYIHEQKLPFYEHNVHPSDINNVRHKHLTYNYLNGNLKHEIMVKNKRKDYGNRNYEHGSYRDSKLFQPKMGYGQEFKTEDEFPKFDYRSPYFENNFEISPYDSFNGLAFNEFPRDNFEMNVRKISRIPFYRHYHRSPNYEKTEPLFFELMHRPGNLFKRPFSRYVLQQRNHLVESLIK